MRSCGRSSGRGSLRVSRRCNQTPVPRILFSFSLWPAPEHLCRWPLHRSPRLDRHSTHNIPSPSSAVAFPFLFSLSHFPSSLIQASVESFQFFCASQPSFFSPSSREQNKSRSGPKCNERREVEERKRRSTGAEAAKKSQLAIPLPIDDSVSKAKDGKLSYNMRDVRYQRLVIVC